MRVGSWRSLLLRVGSWRSLLLRVGIESLLLRVGSWRSLLLRVGSWRLQSLRLGVGGWDVACSQAPSGMWLVVRHPLGCGL